MTLKNPNYIIIMMESLSTNRVHYYGYGKNITPNIDNFASQNIVFKNSMAPASHSDYAQTSFLSSRYTLTNDYRNFFDINYPREFIWDVLKKQNYTTAYISSQNDYWANMIDYYNLETLDFYSHSASDGFYDYDSGNSAKDFDEKTTNIAINYLKNISGPFFLYVNLQATHYPYNYPENNSYFLPDEYNSFFTTYFNIAEEDIFTSNNRYDNSILYVDKNVGKLLDFLKENGLYNNSVIVLTSDHGETIEDIHGFIRHGYSVYDEEIHVPLMIHIPNIENKTIEKRVRGIDIVPTILSFSNFSASKEFQGGIMNENSPVFLFTQSQNYKIGLIKDDIKYIIDMSDNEAEVYNLTIDPLELKNLFEYGKFNYYEKMLLSWYDCQMDYYKEEKWLNNETINCPKYT
jgi:arylsulfatase A-like enzyme